MAATLFRKTTTQYWLFEAWIDAEGKPCSPEAPGARHVKRRRVGKGMPEAEKVKVKSRKWYGRLPGTNKDIPLSANKVAALQMLAKLTTKSELAKVGIADPFEEYQVRPLAEHLADF